MTCIVDQALVEENRKYLLSRIAESPQKVQPRIAMVLGSGLHVLAKDMKDPLIIPYSSIKGFPSHSHESNSEELMQLYIGMLFGVPVALMRYRCHCYEGYSPQQVTFPIRVLHAIGCKRLLLTNAAGGVNFEYKVGDFMMISDHINNSGLNPLVGKNVLQTKEQKDAHVFERFPDMSNCYDKESREAVAKLVKGFEYLSADPMLHEVSRRLRQGVYQMNLGPTYETKAEIKAYRVWGADAVGMSTAIETIVAAHVGMKVTAFSLISNPACGNTDAVLNHKEVSEACEKAKPFFTRLLENVLPLLISLDEKKQ